MKANRNRFNLFRTGRSEMLRGSLYSLLFIVFVTGFLFYLYQYNHRRALENLERDKKKELEDLVKTVQEEMRLAALPLFLFNNSDAARDLFTKRGDFEREFFNDVFLSAIVEAGFYSQIRFIDRGGMEIVRVDREISGDYHVVPPERLQDKSDRYYVTETLKAPEGTIYISPFDLNIEHGIIEVPRKPMIRLGRSVRSEKGEILGIMVINVMGQKILDSVNHHKNHPFERILLLDGNGYYLLTDEREKAFSFMFDELKQIGFFSDYPDVWDKIKSGGISASGSRGLFYIQPFHPLNPRSIPANTLTMYMVIHIPAGEIIRQNRHLVNTLLLNGLLVLPLLVLLGFTLGIFQERNRKYRRELVESATRDSLTGLCNRRMIMEILEKMAGLSRRNGSPLSVVFIDINELKEQNDRYGHESGDALIKLAARILVDGCRQSDTIARLGGDEFLAVLPDCPAEEAQQMIMKASQRFHEEGSTLNRGNLSFSFGCAVLTGDESIESLIARADDLMYGFKRKHKSGGLL